MEVGFYKDLYHEYMVLDKNPDVCESVFEEQLLHNKEITGLLKMKMEYINGSCKYYYDIGRTESLEVIKEGKRLDYQMIFELFEALDQLLDLIKDYLLIADSLWLDASAIFLNKDSKKFCFVYAPTYSKDFKEQLQELLSWLMKGIDHCQKDTVMLVYGLYKMLSEQESAALVLKELKHAQNQFEVIKDKVIEDKKETVYEAYKTVNSAPGITFVADFKKDEEVLQEESLTSIKKWMLYAGGSLLCVGVGIILSRPLSMMLHRSIKINIESFWILMIFVIVAIVMLSAAVWDFIKNIQKNKEPKEEKEFWKESQRPDFTSLLNDETVVLDQRPEEHNDILMLKRIKSESTDQEMVYITHTPFVIGKQYGCVDYHMYEDTVSRRHLEIRKEDRKYKVIDLSSTNGTCLNGKQCSPAVLYDLNHGDRLSIADIQFSVLVKGRQ